MSQQSITSFFNSRKRAAGDDIATTKNKVLLLDQRNTNSELIHQSPILSKETVALVTPRVGGTFKNVKLLSNKKDSLNADPKDVESGSKTRSKAVAKLSFDGMNLDRTVSSVNKKNGSETQPKCKPVAFKKCGNLSPGKRKAAENCIPITAFIQKASLVNSQRNSVKNVSETTTVDKVKQARKDLFLGDAKSKVNGNPRLAELRASIARLNNGFELLKTIETKHSAKAIGLKEFKSLDLEVPTSPRKQANQRTQQNAVQKPGLSSPREELLMSPRKEQLLMSPRKVVVSPVKSPVKVPAYIRHASLAISTSSLPLPHHYRHLAELFRATETVCSLMFNRKETITFAKLKPSVQEMLKKNYTEKHLQQIKHLASDMYTYIKEKVKNFNGSAKKETYELVLSPVLKGHEKLMNPSILLERRREFFNRLLDVVKEHHAHFLVKLDPPMIIAKDKLTRWHPEFDLERIPDVQLSELPEAPEAETYSTAQDVLTRAREMFHCNTRMERALEKLSQAKSRGLTLEEQKMTGLDADGVNLPASQQTVLSSASRTLTTDILNPALRNLPKALLDKIKAKQAAKALEAMTRSTEDDEKCLTYSRLPDLARTLRSIFVTEKKNVLPLKLVLSKLECSFKSKVSLEKLEKDIKCLSEAVPGWVAFYDVRNTQYLKVSREASLAKVMERLDKKANKYNAL